MNATSAATTGARTLLPVVPAAVAAFEAFPPFDSGLVSASPILSDRPRTLWDGQARGVHRPPDGRRAAAWGRGRYVSALSDDSLESDFCPDQLAGLSGPAVSLSTRFRDPVPCLPEGPVAARHTQSRLAGPGLSLVLPGALFWEAA